MSKLKAIKVTLGIIFIPLAVFFALRGLVYIVSGIASYVSQHQEMLGIVKYILGAWATGAIIIAFLFIVVGTMVETLK